MIPAVYLRLDELPRTPSNKIDRNQLPTPVGSTGRTVTEHRRAETALQQQLIDIWADVLGHTDIGIDDDFFELGGHSLLATQIVSRIRVARGLDVPVRAVFEYPTVDLLARHLESARTEQGAALHAPEISRGDRGLPFPLSGPQERMWFIHQLHPEGSGYNMAGALRVRGPLDHARVDRGRQRRGGAPRGAADRLRDRGRRARAADRAGGDLRPARP